LKTFRWIPVILLLAAGLIAIPYGWYYVAGFASYLWDGLGAIYIFLSGMLALNFKPRIFQPLAFAYGLFLLAAWVTGGARDVVALADKAVEIIMVISIAQLIRTTWSVSSKGRTTP
jgi:hypothetical protein